MSYFDDILPRCEYCGHSPTTGEPVCIHGCDFSAAQVVVSGQVPPLQMGNIVFYGQSERDAIETVLNAFNTDDLGEPFPMKDTTTKIELRKGWICPKCDAVVSPDEKTCPNCKPKKPKEESNGDGKTRIQE